ncbi:MAG: hypothetical protein KJ706_07295 [Candidatus Omnitrophica bacterium]|nr:hypothetical protein [Candidatus Omnitrophota bacterium]MBU4590627.1 hypothetical protein [Candidatus Omnitrophota bacterium]
MKKVIVLLLLVVFVAGLVFVADDACAAWRKNKDDEEKAEVVEKAAPAEPEAALICTFKNDEELGEFEQLYVSKQATFGRMGVLQAYFSMEQNNLMEIDRQMEEKFGFRMDPSKMYDLNRDNKEIRELGPIPVAPPTE